MKRIFLVCTGLGRISRGYETFTRQWFDQVNQSNDKRHQYYLLKGGGQNERNEYSILNCYRNSRINKLLEISFRSNPYILEQKTFFICSLPLLFYLRPQLLILSDYRLACYYAHLKRLTGLKYKILFSNGAPNGPPFPLFDCVHQLLPVHRNLAISKGEPERKHILIPYPVIVPTMQQVGEWVQQRTLKSQITIVCVGAINNHHKRAGFLVELVAGLNLQNVHLKLIGQTDKNSNEIILKGKALLGSNFSASTVAPDKVSSMLSNATLFILPSVQEGLPRAAIEALAHGLPVLLHDYAVTKEGFEDMAYYADMTNLEKCTEILRNLLTSELLFDKDMAERRRHFAAYKFSWQNLLPQYNNMVASLVQ